MNIKYFIVSDIHGFFNEFYSELIKVGFDKNNSNHILIICGDVFDRGTQAKQLLDFLLELKQLNKLILIKGNHEDLLDDCLYQIYNYQNISSHHISNGTLDTICQLCDLSSYDIFSKCYNVNQIKEKLKGYFNLLSDSIDYFEFDNYICIHGWIPVITKDSLPIYYSQKRKLDYNEDWKKASNNDWKEARWLGYPQALENNLIIPNKTIICGHWHTSFGNYKYHHKGSGEFEQDSDFGIFEDKGIIALDSAVAFSHKCNIFVLDEKDIINDGRT